MSQLSEDFGIKFLFLKCFQKNELIKKIHPHFLLCFSPYCNPFVLQPLVCKLVGTVDQQESIIFL